MSRRAPDAPTAQELRLAGHRVISQPRHHVLHPRGRKGDAPFLWRKVDGAWQSLSWRDVAGQVASLAAALKAQGLRPGDPVMLVSENRPEFCIADLAIMAAGCVTVPTYTTNTTRDHQHILTDSGARAVIVSTAKLAQTLMPAVLRSQAAFVIGMEPLRGAQGQCDCHLWSDLIAAHPASIDACAAAQTTSRADQACIIYTSGTGGAPRGVMQHHGAILANVEGAGTVVAQDFGWDDEVFLSFLPSPTPMNIAAASSCPCCWAGRSIMPKVSKSSPAISRKPARRSWSWSPACSKSCAPAS